MITDIPTSEEFKSSGMSFLNYAWDIVASLHLDIQNAAIEEWDEDGQVTDEYWEAAQKPLANSAALAQQGVEFLLKAEIADVSPFLLLHGAPSSWPADCQENNTEFAEFRTIDSQDLVRAYDTVAPRRLEPSFRAFVEKLRRRRNAILHTVDKRLRHTAIEVPMWILEISHNLIGVREWPKVRRSYLESAPEGIAYQVEHVPWRVSWELLNVLDNMKPAESKRLLGFDKRARAYICYNCSLEAGYDMEHYPRSAQLKPNTPESRTLYCFVCDSTETVERAQCDKDECQGNVIHEDGVCLTCNQ